MKDGQPDPGWWKCDGCGGDVRPADAYTETVDGGRGNVETLAFCQDCTEDR